jgi:two-component system, cell cycle sensor histidine kinase and response regulator CckA
MSSSRPRTSSIPDRNTALRIMLYVFLVLFMSNLDAMVERVLQPEISYFDEEHLVVGGITGITTILLLGTLEIYLARRKQVEAKLNESNELFRSAFEEAPVGMCLVSPEGRFLRVNNTFCLMLGRPESELFTMSFMDVTHPEDRSASRDWVGQILAGKEVPNTLEKRYLQKAGHVLWGIVGSYLLRSDDGAPLFFITHIQDITDRKLAEAEKEKLQAQLLQAMKMEAVGRLAGGVAHDFNNLLTVITGYSELLLQKIGKDSPMHGQVEEIKRAGERAALLTQQLLAFSRKQIIEPKVVHLDHQVAEMHKMLGRLIGENIELQAITGKSLGAVKVDPGQFQQILMNLAVNARDAMPDGGKIVIETANVDLDEGYCALHPYILPGRFVMLSVSDTGTGMSEEVKAHIFEPFFTTKERGSGTGLGLAMAYGAVHQAGGSIEVYSEVGIGTTFKIYLPRVEEEVAKPVTDDRPQDMRGGSETVLLVEDEDIVRNLCVQILERLGYKVLQARNGAEAIVLAQGFGDRIDLLLTDVVMPGMSGAELATQLVLLHPGMIVLFTSGYTEDVISHHGVLAEGVSFIGKPYTPSALARKVREVLDKP